VYHVPKSLERLQRRAEPSTNVHTETKGVEVVYYIDLGRGIVKIGTSSDFLTRIKAYKLGRANYAERVLAIEFGGRDLERQRHREFAHLRLGRTERFVAENDLWDHIEEVRAKHNIAI
jgi:hypothetical protein